MWRRLADTSGTKTLRHALTVSVLMPMMLPAAALAQFASPDSLNDIAELSDRVYGVRERLREVGTLNEQMRKSAALLLCEMNEGGLKGSVGAALKTTMETQSGAGLKFPAMGKHANLELMPLNSWGISTGLKLSALTNFCLGVDNLVGDWVDLEPLDDLADFEDDYQYYMPPGGSGSSGTGVHNVVVSDQTRSGELSAVFDMTATALLDALVDGYVAMGLDPANEDHVRGVLFGPDVVGAINEVAGLGDDPLDLPLKAVGMILDRLDDLPFLDELTGAMEQVLTISVVDDPCQLGLDIVPDGACDFAQSLIAFLVDGVETVSNVPNLFTFADAAAWAKYWADSTGDLAAQFAAHIGGIRSLLDQYLAILPDAVDVVGQVHQNNLWTNFLGTMTNGISEVKSDLYDAISLYSIDDKGYVDLGLGFCAYHFIFQAYLTEPEFDVTLGCGATTEEFEDFWESVGIWAMETIIVVDEWIGGALESVDDLL